MALAAVAACGGNGPGVTADDASDTALSLSDEAVIEYHFGDSSVPPEYHRSYDLTVTKGNVHIVVDSYGTLINEVDRPLDDDVWSVLIDEVDSVDGLAEGSSDDGCTGGTSSTLKIVDGGTVVVNADAFLCGGEGSEALNEFVAPVVASISDFDELLAIDG